MTHAAESPSQNQSSQSPPAGLTEIGVSGFKSFRDEVQIKLGSLTILAGANSSGKSSIMQPLLMMKQTLEAPYDPGALLLDGPNVSFTSGEQFLSKFQTNEVQKAFTISVSNNRMLSKSTFNWSSDSGIDILKQKWTLDDINFNLEVTRDMSEAVIKDIVERELRSFTRLIDSWKINRNRCFFQLIGTQTGFKFDFANPTFSQLLTELIHVQGLRDIPSRVYKTAAITGNTFSGRFENYVASVINYLQKSTPEKLVQLQAALQKLGLTDLIQSQRLNDTQIELRVGRVLGSQDETDTVNIADVGFGVSQVLPVIVALLVAEPGQLVYIEQPEIHLHPRAQIALGEIFADAANRGVRVVVETHSELFLLGIQTLVAEDKLDPSAVKLHWLTRNPDGSSKVTSAELDETGAFGDWPEDFGTTALMLENRYLSAAEAKLWNGNGSHG
jgi:predicted ATPase